MKIKGEKKELTEIVILLKKARIKAQGLPCYCEDVTCEKHKIVDDITKAEGNVEEILATY